MASLEEVLDSLREFDTDQLNDFNNVGSWPMAVKVIMWVLAFAATCALGWFLHVTNLRADLAKVQKEETQLRSDYEKKAFEAAHLEGYRQQQVEMEESFQVILRQLPGDTEIPGLIEDITLVGNKNGLNFESIDLKPEVRHEFYVEKPIEIIVSGSYHDLGSFVSDVADLSRIVTLHDFQISPVGRRGRGAQQQQASANDGSGLLQMQITAKTYRYNDESG